MTAAAQHATDGATGGALDSFKYRLKDYTRTAVCGRPYVLVERFKRDHLQENHIEDLLTTIYRTQPGPPIRPSTIVKHYRTVFIILLESRLSGLGQLIEVFQNQKITDAKLPISRSELKNRMKLEILNEERAEKVAKYFDEAQWRFCPYVFGESESGTLQSEWILPISHRKQINNKGGTAQLYEIVVLEDFVSPSLRKRVPKAAFTSNQDADGKRYTFALKTFAGSNQAIYHAEKTAFNGLYTHNGIVKCLGCYKHCGPVSTHTRQAAEDTYNILLEFGELDLEEYFHKHEPPVFQVEIESFWKDLFAVARALSELHNFEWRTNSEVTRYNGWHGDIKPANILFINDDFKLADPGFAKFVPKQAGNQPQKVVLNGGTWTYGAPENLFDGHRREVTQAFDIWSLGCVFLEAATWVIGGSAAVRAFVDVRKNAVQRAKSLGSNLKNLKSGDCFHDGKEVIKEISDWHNTLRSAIRKNDNVTERVLTLVEEKMLLTEADARVDAQRLVKELNAIMGEADDSTKYPIPQNIMQAFLTADQQGTDEPQHHSDRRSGSVAKSSDDKKLLFPIKKTAQRSEYLRSALGSSDTIKGNGADNNPGIEEHDAMGTYSAAQAQSTISRATGTSTSRRTPSVNTRHHSTPERKTSSASRASPAHPGRFPVPPQTPERGAVGISNRCDVFTARKALEKAKGSFTGRMRRVAGLDQKKDEKLSLHIKNRDIVFLVDNASSMLPYWNNAEFLLTTLVSMCAGHDKNGMDLYFTLGSEKLEGSDRMSDFEKAMNNAKPSPQEESARTDISDSIGEILNRHLEYFKRSLRPKHLTIIVLTDGLWQGMDDKDSVKGTIAFCVKEVMKTPATTRSRPISVQFIQFGRDLEATLRLIHLDNNLQDEMSIPDVVDHEPCDGDVYKMILGSFVFDFDRRDTNTYLPTSPSFTESFTTLSTVESPPEFSPTSSSSYHTSKAYM